METKSDRSKATASQAKTEHASPLEIVLQWLSYAFWGLLVGSLMWLVVIVLNLAIRGVVFDGVTPYALAAVLVLLPIAYVTDIFYRRHEPAKKVGMAAVVMVLHAVLFALLAIGTLIGAVFTGVSLLLSIDSDTSMSVIVLLSLLIAALLYALLFVRTITPQRPKKLSFIVSLVLLIVSLGLFAWGIAGPAVQSVVRKDDRRIEQNISEVQRAVSDYATANNKLPESLGDVHQSMSKNAQSIVDDKLVTYKQEPSVTLHTSRQDVADKQKYKSTSLKLPKQELRYQLCATYKASSPNHQDGNSYDGEESLTRDGYRTFVSDKGHDKGEVCYKLRVDTALMAQPYENKNQNED